MNNKSSPLPVALPAPCDMGDLCIGSTPHLTADELLRECESLIADLRSNHPHLAAQAVEATKLTPIDEMCKILESRNINANEYIDCNILYKVTFDQLRALYDFGRASLKDNAS